MKKFAAAAFILFATAARADERTIDVNITGFENNNGHALVTLVNTAEQFDGKAKALLDQKVVIEKNAIKVRFENIVPGEYAIVVVHDENDNGKLDMNFVGIPKEAFGFSNNPVIRRGPPKYEEAKFPVAKTNLALDVKVAMLKLF